MEITTTVIAVGVLIFNVSGVAYMFVVFCAAYLISEPELWRRLKCSMHNGRNTRL